ncbi:MAG: hypothetical protein IT239_07190, partial [Bacteroidia bacterium]|nr:hypothetical protein [Bacteroidia bacterium]
LTNLYKTESEKHFSHGVTHLLMDKLNLSLPDTFLKRWIKLFNDKPVTDEQLEKEYPSYANDLRLQLVEDKITKENNIAVSKEETEHYIKALVTDNFIQYGQEPDEALISSTVQQVLKNKEEFKKIYSKLFADKLRAFYLTKLLVTYQEITAEDFSKKIEEHYKHHHNH